MCVCLHMHWGRGSGVSVCVWVYTLVCVNVYECECKISASEYFFFFSQFQVHWIFLHRQSTRCAIKPLKTHWWRYGSTRVQGQLFTAGTFFCAGHWGWGCSSVVKHQAWDQKVAGLIPSRGGSHFQPLPAPTHTHIHLQFTQQFTQSILETVENVRRSRRRKGKSWAVS